MLKSTMTGPSLIEALSRRRLWPGQGTKNLLAAATLGVGWSSVRDDFATIPICASFKIRTLRSCKCDVDEQRGTEFSRNGSRDARNPILDQDLRRSRPLFRGAV